MRIISVLIVLTAISINANAAVVVGNSKGSVTMIEVYDYQCSHCMVMYPVVKKLERENRDLKIRLMPVAILNKLSLIEATAAIVASKYDIKFMQFTDLAMNNPPNSQHQVDILLKNLGLNTKDFQMAMHKQWVYQQIIEGLNFLKVEKSGTPLFIIYPTKNQKLSVVLSGEQSHEVLQRAINQAKDV